MSTEKEKFLQELNQFVGEFQKEVNSVYGFTTTQELAESVEKTIKSAPITELLDADSTTLLTQLFILHTAKMLVEYKVNGR